MKDYPFGDPPSNTDMAASSMSCLVLIIVVVGIFAIISEIVELVR